MNAEKYCPKCGRTLPIAAFCKDVHRPDQLAFYCRDCYRSYHPHSGKLISKFTDEQLIEELKKRGVEITK